MLIAFGTTKTTTSTPTRDEWRVIEATEFPPPFGWSRECRLQRESGFGAFRRWRDVRLKSVMHFKADIGRLI